jgi:hypothetical protein
VPATTQTYTIEVATATGANPSTWTDVTAYVKRFVFRRGRDDLLSKTNPGTASLYLDNADGRFSPAKSSSPVYPHVQLMRAVRIKTVLSAVTYDRFFGYIQSVRPRPRLDQQECQIDLTDGSAWLALYKTTPTYGSVPTNTAIGTALDSASWPAGLRNLDTAISSVAPAFADQDVLSQVNNLVFDNEGGLFFFDGAGSAVFHNRHKRYSGTYVTSQATFATTGTLRLTDLISERPARDVANEVKVTYLGGLSATSSDATSQTNYGPRRLDVNAQWLSQSEATGRSQWALLLRKDPKDRPVVTLMGRNNTLLTQILTRTLAERITVTGPTVSGVSGDFHIESLSVSVDAASLVEQCEWQLSPVDTATYFILDDATRGQLDDDQLAP